MDAPFKIHNALLCDYVGRGENGKTTLVNVLSGDVLVPMFPFDAVFGVFIEAFSPANSIIDIELVIDGRRFGGVEVRYENDAPGPALLVIQTFGVRVEKPSILEINAGLRGKRAIKAISKTFMLGPTMVGVPNASPPPSSQLQSAPPKKASPPAPRRPSSRRPAVKT